MTPPTKAMLELADEIERIASFIADEIGWGNGAVFNKEHRCECQLCEDERNAVRSIIKQAFALRSSQNGERERVIEEALEKMECDCRGAHREYLKMQSRTVSPLTIANIYERIADELDAIRALKSGEKGS